MRIDPVLALVLALAGYQWAKRRAIERALQSARERGRAALDALPVPRGLLP